MWFSGTYKKCQLWSYFTDLLIQSWSVLISDSGLLSMLQNIFSLFYQLNGCWSSFAIICYRWNWSHDKDYILGLADLLCHITKNPNPNCKPVSGFQNLLKTRWSIHQNFSHKMSSLYQPSLNNGAESPNDDHSHSKYSVWTRFIVLNDNATNSVL